MKNKHYFLLLTVISFSTIFSVFAFTGIDTGISKIILSYQIGDVAEDFKLKNVDGKMVSLADFEEAKGFIVIFTCNTCPVSVANEDRIIALNEKYQDLGYPVIAINPNNPEISSGDSYELMKVRAKEKGFEFPYLFDDGQKVYPKYGASKTPHVYVLNKENNKLLVKYIGSIDDSARNAGAVKTKYVENAVDALIKGSPIEVASTKAIGCSIKK
ncbi:thioredoxin family protein [Lutimonas sp.]|jgi:peroxiredoxin|uniref:thioredoxin family protein n=1 Tax=Lutimonas sp. TaxID=1872403 RepID=UPI003C732EAB